MQSTRSERRRRRRRPHPTIPHTTTPVSTSSLNIITPADIVEITAFAFGERVTPAIPQQQQPKTYEQPASPANESDATEDSLPRLSLLSFTSLASSVLSLPVCASSGDDVHGSNVHDCLESLSEMIPGQAVKSTRCLSFVQNYVIPAAHFADRKFGQDPAILRYVLLHLVALDTIILTCSLGITSAATAGRLVLGAIAATAVGVACDKYDWGSFLPALGVILLVNGSLGLPGLMGLVTFLSVNYANDWVGPSNKGRPGARERKNGLANREEAAFEP